MSKRIRKSTMVELVAILEEKAQLDDSAELREIIDEAKAGEYHDYKNTKYACGKVEASMKLRAAGYTSIAMRIEDGEFDEEADEQDKEMMRKDIDRGVSDPVQAAAMKKVLGL